MLRTTSLSRRSLLTAGAIATSMLALPRFALASTFNGGTDFLANGTFGVFPEYEPLNSFDLGIRCYRTLTCNC